MIDGFLKSKLDRVIRRARWLAFWRMLAACWAGAALIGAAIVSVERTAGRALPGALPLVVIVALGLAVTLAILQLVKPPDYRWISRRIEATFPELKGVLLTAVEQPLDEGEPDFLRHRVLYEAIARSQEQDWRSAVPARRLIAVHFVHVAALACLAVTLVALYQLDRRWSAEPRNVAAAEGVTVNPGDATLERGETLVVLARFGSALPTAVNMVIRENGTTPRTVSFAKSLADPVFGGSVTNIQQGFTYHLEYGDRRTRDFAVAVYEHPRLVRADATLTFPSYTKLAAKRVEDTTRLSAVEGTRVDLALQLNKPVRSAQLVARDDAKTTIAVEPEPGQPAARLSAWTPAKSGTYDLVLVDADGRKNKVASPFVIAVQPNRPPEIRLAAPRGDLRPSALEEVTFDGTVWDDFGTLAFGLAYTSTDGAEKSVELGREVAAKEKKSFRYLLDLESLGAKPDDLVSWHVWADDIGPDGKVRRTAGDLYFAEVRPFDEVFRESQMQSAQGAQAGAEGGEGMRRLVELQKQIITATWNLQRNTGAPKKDVEVVRESQEQALEQAKAASEDVRSPRARGLWAGATRDMGLAIERLRDATNGKAPLAQALPPEQSAYQTLLKLQDRETSVTRGQRNQGGSGQRQASQRQMDQLDLQQAENRYETQRQARAPQNPQQKEQLAVMNRLQDLARRQQDLNARLQELQTALQEARTENEREELRQRLKRLEDEQRQMLADADELRQRMERPDNQSAMSPQRQQLDQARDDLQRAADAASQGSVAQALSSGTRAQRQLQQTRDELRQQNSSQFGEDLREMRADARELSRRSEQLDRRIAEAGKTDRRQKSLSGASADPELARQLAEQRERWNKLFDRARQVSEQAENTEPLVSKHLYDSVRKASQADEASVSQLQQDLLGRGELTYELRDRLEEASQSQEPGKALELAREMLREGNVAAAGESARRATSQVDELRRGVERAAESVLGDDAEQLKLARSELDQLTQQLQREMGGDQNGENGERGEQNAANQKGGTQKGGTQKGGPGDGSNRQKGGAADAPSLANQDASQEQSGSGESQDPGAKDPGGKSGAGRGQAKAGGRGNAGSDRSANIDNVMNGIADGPLQAGGSEGRGGGGGGFGGPLTGETFGPWTDRLRDVEQLLDSPDLRDAVATARERARGLRRDFTQSKRKPDWAVVNLQVVRPLVEVRNRVAEELARRETKDSLAPIDHDPVPTRFAESVRRYYEELGKDGAPTPRTPASN